MKPCALIFLSFLLGASVAQAVSLPPIEQSEAYRRYAVRRNPSELSKLNYLFDRFASSNFQIRYGGRWYAADWSMKQARAYLQKYYDKESAEEFVQVHAYRPTIGSELVYIQFPGENGARLLRNVLLEELRSLRRIEKERG